MSAENGMNAATFQRLIDEALPFAGDMEMEVVHLSPGNITLRMPCRDNALRPGGTISGPAMMGLADTAMYGLVLSRLPDAAGAVTTSLTINFLQKPAAVDLLAEGQVLKLGRRLAVMEVSLYSVGRPDPVAHVTGTYALPPS